MERFEFKVGHVVRFARPLSNSERDARFVVANVNEVTGRAYIELICDEAIRPQELVSLSEIQPVPIESGAHAGSVV